MTEYDVDKSHHSSFLSFAQLAKCSYWLQTGLSKKTGFLLPIQFLFFMKQVGS